MTERLLKGEIDAAVDFAEVKRQFSSDNMADLVIQQQQDIERCMLVMGQWLTLYPNVSITSGACCCGESMENHTRPMDAGHTPTDLGTYVADQCVKMTSQLLGLLKENYHGTPPEMPIERVGQEPSWGEGLD